MLCLIALAAVICRGEAPAAAPSRPSKSRPSTSRASRDDAIRSIPFDKLDAESRGKVNAVLEDVSLYRRLPTQVIRCDPALYQFTIEHPDVTVDMWHVLDISKVDLRRTGPGCFQMDDSEGVRAEIEYLHSGQDTHVIYSTGAYSGPLFTRPVRGRCVMVLRSGFVRETNGEHYITSRLDTFIRVDHFGAELIAKTFQPVVGKVIDHNFLEATAFVSRLSRTAEVNAASTRSLTERLTQTRPEARQELISLLDRIGEKAGERASAAKVHGPISQAATARADRSSRPSKVPSIRR